MLCNGNKSNLMEMNELAALRAALKLFANTRNEVARRAKVSPTYVTEVLKGNFKHMNKTVQKVLREAKKLHAELDTKHNELKTQLPQPVVMAS